MFKIGQLCELTLRFLLAGDTPDPKSQNQEPNQRPKSRTNQDQNQEPFATRNVEKSQGSRLQDFTYTHKKETIKNSVRRTF